MTDVPVLEVRVARNLARGVMDCCIEAGATGVSEKPTPEGETALTVYGAPAELDRAAVAVRRYMDRWSPKVVFRCELTLLAEDWRREWASHLQEVQLTETIRLVPVLDVSVERAPAPDVVYLEAGLVFGFGEHPTTRMAARWVEAHAPQTSLLDVGTGTGILAFVAARAAAREVVGLDIDPESVISAQSNAKRNAIERCTFSCEPVQELLRDFDVVVANVDALTLTQLAAAIAGRIRVGGALALTGVLAEQAEPVVRAYAQQGVTLSHIGDEDDWVLLSGTKTRTHDVE